METHQNRMGTHQNCKGTNQNCRYCEGFYPLSSVGGLRVFPLFKLSPKKGHAVLQDIKGTLQDKKGTGACSAPQLKTAHVPFSLQVTCSSGFVVFPDQNCLRHAEFCSNSKVVRVLVSIQCGSPTTRDALANYNLCVKMIFYILQLCRHKCPPKHALSLRVVCGFVPQALVKSCWKDTLGRRWVEVSAWVGHYMSILLKHKSASKVGYVSGDGAFKLVEARSTRYCIINEQVHESKTSARLVQWPLM